MRSSLLALAAALVACSNTSIETSDAAVTSDAGNDGFVTTADAGSSDASDAFVAPADAATADDAGPADDANVPDAGPCMASGACDPFDPTSCGTMACRPGASGTACGMISATPVGLGMPCPHDADCEAGLVCLTFPMEGPICHRMCPVRSIGACDTGYACNGTIGDTCIDVCRPIPAMCDVYTQDCPTSTDTCTLVRNPETNDPYTGCRPAGTQTEGMPCGGTDGTCDHALICVSIAGAATCHHVCDPMVTPTACTSPAMCTGTTTTWGVHYCIAP